MAPRLHGSTSRERPRRVSFEHAFEAEIVRHFMGTNARGELFYTVVFVPPEVLAALPAGGPIRVEGEIAELPFTGALMPTAGRRYIMVPTALMRERSIAVGDEVEVRFSLADPDAVDVPDELRLALRAEEAVADAWDTLTAGRRRALAHRIASAKRAETRENRTAEIVGALRDGRDFLARKERR